MAKIVALSEAESDILVERMEDKGIKGWGLAKARKEVALASGRGKWEGRDNAFFLF